MIEGAFRDAKCTGNVVHGHLSHPLRLEKLGGAVNHLDAPAFVALFVKFSIHTVVVERTLPAGIAAGSCVLRERIHGEFTTFFGQNAISTFIFRSKVFFQKLHGTRWKQEAW